MSPVGPTAIVVAISRFTVRQLSLCNAVEDRTPEYATGAWSPNELQWLDLKVGNLDSGPSNEHYVETHTKLTTDLRWIVYYLYDWIRLISFSFIINNFPYLSYSVCISFVDWSITFCGHSASNGQAWKAVVSPSPQTYSAAEYDWQDVITCPALIDYSTRIWKDWKSRRMVANPSHHTASVG